MKIKNHLITFFYFVSVRSNFYEKKKIQASSALVCFASVCLNGMDSGRKRSTTVEFDPIVLAQSARGMFSSLLHLPEIIRSCQSCRLHKNASWACFACCKLSRPPKWKFRGSVWQSQNCRGSCRKWTQPHRSDHLKEDPPASKDKIRKILLSLKKTSATSNSLRWKSSQKPNLTQKRLWDPLEDENEALPCHPPLGEDFDFKK